MARPRYCTTNGFTIVHALAAITFPRLQRRYCNGVNIMDTGIVEMIDSGKYRDAATLDHPPFHDNNVVVTHDFHDLATSLSNWFILLTFTWMGLNQRHLRSIVWRFNISFSFLCLFFSCLKNSRRRIYIYIYKNFTVKIRSIVVQLSFNTIICNYFPEWTIYSASCEFLLEISRTSNVVQCTERCRRKLGRDNYGDVAR